jgi:hydrogenase nickel incorporation protein HypA/HybF
MHEHSLIVDLIRKIEVIARENHAQRVVRVKLRLGALSHMSQEHMREHFAAAAQGTLAQGAVLESEVSTDIDDPRARDIVLDSVDVED